MDTYIDIDNIRPTAEPQPSLHTIHQTHEYAYDESEWTMDDDGKWKPPPPSAPNIIALNHDSEPTPDNSNPTINRTNDGNNSFQNDSGANRVVTDKLDNLQNIHIMDPISMGGCK